MTVAVACFLAVACPVAVAVAVTVLWIPQSVCTEPSPEMSNNFWGTPTQDLTVSQPS